jgi:hypothetical protein
MLANSNLDAAKLNRTLQVRILQATVRARLLLSTF